MVDKEQEREALKKVLGSIPHYVDPADALWGASHALLELRALEPREGTKKSTMRYCTHCNDSRVAPLSDVAEVWYGCTSNSPSGRHNWVDSIGFTGHHLAGQQVSSPSPFVEFTPPEVEPKLYYCVNCKQTFTDLNEFKNFNCIEAYRGDGEGHKRSTHTVVDTTEYQYVDSARGL
jgi:hypothetical protein